MDALKWILKASIVVAMAFFGLQAEPQKENPSEPEKSTFALFN